MMPIGSPLPPSGDARFTHRDLSWLSWAAILVALLAVIAVLSELGPTVMVLLTPGPKTGAEAEQDQERRVAQFNERTTKSLALAQGRSMFVVPPKPGDAGKTEVAKTEATENGADAPKPTRYTGPDPIAVVNNSVWFSDSTVVSLGNERQGIRVVSLDHAPWSVRLKWRNVEFDVPIFENTTSSFVKKPDSSGRPHRP